MVIVRNVIARRQGNPVPAAQGDAALAHAHDLIADGLVVGSVNNNPGTRAVGNHTVLHHTVIARDAHGICPGAFDVEALKEDVSGIVDIDDVRGRNRQIDVRFVHTGGRIEIKQSVCPVKIPFSGRVEFFQHIIKIVDGVLFKRVLAAVQSGQRAVFGVCRFNGGGRVRPIPKEKAIQPHIVQRLPGFNFFVGRIIGLKGAAPRIA